MPLNNSREHYSRIVQYYSQVPNKRRGAFNRREGKKQPELISVQCRGAQPKLSKLIIVQDILIVQG